MPKKKQNKPIVLFDVDGTLIRGSKLHFHTFNTIMQEMFDLSLDNINWTQYAGNTDKGIINNLLLDSGVTKKELNEKMEEIINKMNSFYCEHIDEEEGYVLPGVNEILKFLIDKGAYLGLVTGNLEPIAHNKIKKIGIKHTFEFGGFGNEDWDRAIFMNYAIEKAIKRYKLDPILAWNNVFYVGDTPFDVRATRNAEKYMNNVDNSIIKSKQIKSIVVGTGYYKKPEFKDCKPDLWIENFESDDEILKFREFLNLK